VNQTYKYGKAHYEASQNMGEYPGTIQTEASAQFGTGFSAKENTNAACITSLLSE
jgi:hypothetical protein